MEEKKVFGIIYRHRNIKNNKSYIGQTTRNPEKRFTKKNKTFKGYKSCPAFLNSLKTYGWNGFETEILEKCYSQDELNRREEYYINLYNSIAPNGYNTDKIVNGSVKRSESSKQKMRERRLAHNASLEVMPEGPNKKQHIFIDGVSHKECAKCKSIKLLSEYGKNKPRWDKLNNYCKSCHNEKRMKSYVPTELSEKDWKESYVKRKKALSVGQKNRFADGKEAEKLSKERSQPVIATNVKTRKETYFTSGLAAHDKGFNRTGVSRACRTGKEYKGYTWRKV